MKTFYYKVFDYIYKKRLELFQALFYDLYKGFGGKQEEFLKAWFEYYTVRKLLSHFPFEDIFAYYPKFAYERRSLLKSYIRTYWSFCQRPFRYPTKVQESMNFFGLRELSEDSLKRAYRKMVRSYHPDKHPDRSLAHKKMLLINYHYQVLLSYLKEAMSCSRG